MKLIDQVLLRDNNKPIVWDAYFNNNNKPKPIVVFCHGYKGFKDWGPWNLVAKQFCDADMFFTKFNFSHNGGTVVDPIDFPDLNAFAENNYTKELDDLDDILNYLLSESFEYHHEINRSQVTLIGHSRGGGISIIKTSEDQRITNLITWASICDFGQRMGTSEEIELWRKAGVKYVLNGRTKQHMPHNFQFYENFKANEDRLHIESAIKTIDVPMMIVHAEDDSSVKFTEAEALHSWNPNTKLIRIENSNHVFDGAHPWERTELPQILLNVVKKSIHFLKR